MLVANINLRKTMTQLQEVANLGSESEAMQSLRSQMKDANKTMLSQEQAMADLLGEITAMASSWSSLAMSVSLAQVPAAEMCEALGLSRVLLKLKAVKEVEDCNVDALAEALDENLKNFSNQCGVEEEQATFERLRDELEQAKKDLSKLDEDLIEQELKLDELLADNHFIMRQVRFLAEMEKVAGIQSDTMKALKEAHQAHDMTKVASFGLDVLGDILLVGLGQFVNRRRKKGRSPSRSMRSSRATLTKNMVRWSLRNLLRRSRSSRRTWRRSRPSSKLRRRPKNTSWRQGMRNTSTLRPRRWKSLQQGAVS